MERDSILVNQGEVGVTRGAVHRGVQGKCYSQRGQRDFPRGEDQAGEWGNRECDGRLN